MTKTINAILAAYGIMCIGMGIQAAFFPHEGVKASMVSLIAAGSLGALMLVSIYVWTKKPRAGRIMSLVLALLSLGNFLPKYMKAPNMYPAGITIIASFIVLIVLIMGHGLSMRTKKRDGEA